MAKAIKAVQLSLLLLVAIGAVAAAPAAAASPEWWVEGSEIAKAETIAETVTVKKGATFTVSGTTISCSTVKMKSGVIEPGNKNSGTLAFGNCSIVGEPKCEVVNFNSEPLVFPLERTSGALKLNFLPANGSTLAMVKVNTIGAGPCAAAGTYTVTSGAKAGMECSYPDVETEKKEHRLVFNSETGSVVSINGVKATFEGEFIVTLASGNKWSAK
jgi:hypothetical protein